MQNLHLNEMLNVDAFAIHLKSFCILDTIYLIPGKVAITFYHCWLITKIAPLLVRIPLF